MSLWADEQRAASRWLPKYSVSRTLLLALSRSYESPVLNMLCLVPPFPTLQASPPVIQSLSCVRQKVDLECLPIPLTLSLLPCASPYSVIRNPYGAHTHVCIIAHLAIPSRLFFSSIPSCLALYLSTRLPSVSLGFCHHQYCSSSLLRSYLSNLARHRNPRSILVRSISLLSPAESVHHVTSRISQQTNCHQDPPSSQKKNTNLSLSHPSKIYLPISTTSEHISFPSRLGTTGRYT